MKVFCEKCNQILPKGKIECDKCGYINESLYPKLEKAKARKKVIIILSMVSAAVVVLIICNAMMLYPWQYRARHNRKAILEYARDNYPGAKIVKEYYPTMEFNPTGNPYDAILFEFNGIKFYIRGRNGKVNYNNDGYGFALLANEIRERYLNTFFSWRGLSYDPNINFFNYDNYWPQRDAELNTFPGFIRLDFIFEYESDKQFPRDFDWLYDFYCYWKEVCPTDGFSLRFCYRINKNTFCQLNCDSKSEFANEDDFYSSFE